MTVLVGYASAHGSTKGIAERIAHRLGEQGFTAEFLPMAEVRDPAAYEAVVLGSAVHDQAWLPEAVAFLRQHEDALADRPVWLFSVGMGAAVRGLPRRLIDKQRLKIAEAFPVAARDHEHRVFSGVIRAEHLPRSARVIARAMGVRYGDHRDWTAIDAWADGIASRLLPVG